MRMLKKKTIKTVRIYSFLAMLTFSTNSLAVASDHQESIPLDSASTPANDLVYQSQILNPEQAELLKKNQHLDLSSLNPDTSGDLWKNLPLSPNPDDPVLVDRSLEISEDSVSEFLGAVQSREGQLRFNLRTEGSSPQMVTGMIGVTAHTALLERALLIRLGYVVPSMKFYPQIRVHFSDLETKSFFLTTKVLSDTNRAPEHWVAKAEDISSDNLTITLQDVIVMATKQDIYNLAIAAPTLNSNNQAFPLPERYRRALIIPYALADLDESVNQYGWTVGRISDHALVLPAPQRGDFNCSLDDALWISRKVAALKREDFVKIVQAAKFPEPVEKLLIEKLISRRNSLLELLGTKNVPLPFDSKITLLPTLKNGKLLAKDWPGYASRFAYGDPDSPIKGIKYFALSELESNTISNLIARANDEIPSLNIQSATSAHQQTLLTQQLTKFFSSGVISPTPLRKWIAPLAQGGVQASRNLVLGSYLGTDNLVQIADSIGISGSAGFYIALDGLPNFLGANGSLNGSINVSYTHLRPVLNLKAAVKEPFKNMMVPWLQFRATEKLQALSRLKDNSTLNATDEKNKMEELMNQFRSYLGVGDSLIMTVSTSANESLEATLSSSAPASPSVIGELGFNQMLISRIQIYRRSENEIQVFKDRGELGGVQLAAEFSLGSPTSFPVFSMSLADNRGTANVRYFNLNINPSLSQNPQFYQNAAALKSTLMDGSVEALSQASTPYQLKINFNDKSSSLSFFHWRRRGLKADGAMEVTAPDGAAAKFISLSDGVQTGKHYQSLATEAASYVTERLTSNQGTIQTQSANDPGQSLYGHSHTRKAEFQARAVEHSVVDPLVRISSHWEGWKESEKDMQKAIDEITEKYHFSFYSQETWNQVKSLQLYEIVVGLDIHKEGLLKLASLSAGELNGLSKKYTALYSCDKAIYDIQHMSDDDKKHCSAMDDFYQAWSDYQKQINKEKPSANAIAQDLLHLGNSAEILIPFTELPRLLGGEANFYLYSEVRGYRVGSEDISTPIISNTLGLSSGQNDQGPVDQVQSLIGIQSGEFNATWIREVL